MKMPYSRPLVILVLVFLMLLAWTVGPVLNEYGSHRLKIVLICSVGLAFLGVYLFNARRRMVDRAAGRYSEDEYTRLARMNAGNAAFRMSLVLWLAIFAAQDVFDTTRSMLGAGILGQCGLYGICLLAFNRSGSFHED